MRRRLPIPATVERLVVLWEYGDRIRARWEQAFGEPFPSLEDQLAARERLDEDERA